MTALSDYAPRRSGDTLAVSHAPAADDGPRPVLLSYAGSAGAQEAIERVAELISGSAVTVKHADRPVLVVPSPPVGDPRRDRAARGTRAAA